MGEGESIRVGGRLLLGAEGGWPHLIGGNNFNYFPQNQVSACNLNNKGKQEQRNKFK